MRAGRNTRTFRRWASILGFVAIALCVMPTWRTDNFLEIKRVRVFSIGVLREPVLRVREVLVPVSRGAVEWTRLSRRLDGELFGPSAIVLAASRVLPVAGTIARGRSGQVLERATSWPALHHEADAMFAVCRALGGAFPHPPSAAFDPKRSACDVRRLELQPS